jgi:hypothetical protein
MNKNLINFLIKAKKSGYAAGNQTKETDSSYSTRFEEGDFKFHDNWFGEKSFGGRETVFCNGIPCWIMFYYGAELTDGSEAIPTLRKALSQMPDTFPARGPKILKDGEFTYENNWQGDIENFSGVETIKKSGKLVFKTNYAGGLVDLKKEE